MRDAGLSSVAADTPEDAWAVGIWSRDVTKPPQGLIEHWDGSRWRLVASPAVPAVLLGVSVTAAEDAWAVGESASEYESGYTSHAFAVAEHWDGHRWRRVPTPRLRSLAAVAETSADDVWAVGADTSGAAVVLHRAGSHWQVRPRLPDHNLVAVAALSPNDLWVGGSEPAKKISRYLEMHWDGKRWSRYSQPSSPDEWEPPVIAAIGASNGRDVWAAGHEEGPNGDGAGYFATALLHWNGTAWRKVSTPQNRFVSSLALRAPHDIAIVGLVGNGDSPGDPFLEERVGGRWQDAALGSGEALSGLSPDQQQGLWGVGATGRRFDPSGGYQTRSQPLIKWSACF
jgi:hypothetical protein